VKRHVARVDLGDLLGYHADKIEKDRVTIPKGFTSGLGWDVDDYSSFRDWQKSRTTAFPAFHVRYILRKDLDTLIVFYDGRFQFAEAADGSKVRVHGGVLPDSLLAHLRETVVPHCPITILTDEGADLILGVLRSVLRLDR